MRTTTGSNLANRASSKKRSAGYKCLGGLGKPGRNRALDFSAEALAGPSIVENTQKENGRNGRASVFHT